MAKGRLATVGAGVGIVRMLTQRFFFSPESTMQTSAKECPSFNDLPCVSGAQDIRGFSGGSVTRLDYVWLDCLNLVGLGLVGLNLIELLDLVGLD